MHCIEHSLSFLLLLQQQLFSSRLPVVFAGAAGAAMFFSAHLKKKAAVFSGPLVVLPKTSMVKPVDVNGGPARTRRRYTQGNTRSKTIELGTLSEVEEDIYHNKDGL